MLLASPRLSVVVLTLQSWSMAGKFYSGVESARFAQAGVGVARSWQVMLMNRSH